ncbi:MAG: DUF6134 family protein, partial [Ginsengibacter sp.]
MKQASSFPIKIYSAIKFVALLFCFTGIYHTHVYAQQRKLIYDVTRNGKNIGEIIFIDITRDQKKYINLTSDVKTRFVFSFTDHSIETAEYENGILKYSSFYQQQNGAYKARKMTFASGNYYKLVDNGAAKLVNFRPINYNMLLLYISVPENITKVYSDNYQTLLELKKVAENKYRLTLPGGDYNYYTYT